MGTGRRSDSVARRFSKQPGAHVSDLEALPLLLDEQLVVEQLHKVDLALAHQQVLERGQRLCVITDRPAGRETRVRVQS